MECRAEGEREGAEVITMGNGRLLTQDEKELKCISTILLLFTDDELLTRIC